MRPAGQPHGTRPAFTAAQQQQVHQLRAEACGIMLRVAQMAQKYDTAIEQLNQEAPPQKKQWIGDVQALSANNVTPEQQ